MEIAPMNVVVWGKIHQSGLAMLQSAPGVSVAVVDPRRDNAIDPHIAEAAAILVRTSLLPASLIARATKLKVVSRYGVGYDNIDVAALTQRKIPLAVVGKDNAASVAEQTLYLMLAAAKAGLLYDRATRSGDWFFRDSLVARDLSGKRLLIVGLGRIGQVVGNLCQAFGMTITFYDPHVSAVALGLNWAQSPDLMTGLREADVVTIHAPLLPTTRALIGEKEMAAMKPSSIIVSTSRGGLVDEGALARALANGTIHAAGLDVFEKEPVTADNPLLKLDNVVLSPHMAALSYECAERMSLTAAKNCLDGLLGHLDPARVVNAEVLRG